MEFEVNFSLHGVQIEARSDPAEAKRGTKMATGLDQQAWACLIVKAKAYHIICLGSYCLLHWLNSSLCALNRHVSTAQYSCQTSADA